MQQPDELLPTPGFWASIVLLHSNTETVPHLLTLFGILLQDNFPRLLPSSRTLGSAPASLKHKRKTLFLSYLQGKSYFPCVHWLSLPEAGSCLSPSHPITAFLSFTKETSHALSLSVVLGFPGTSRKLHQPFITLTWMSVWKPHSLRHRPSPRWTEPHRPAPRTLATAAALRQRVAGGLNWPQTLRWLGDAIWSAWNYNLSPDDFSIFCLYQYSSLLQIFFLLQNTR